MKVFFLNEIWLPHSAEVGGNGPHTYADLIYGQLMCDIEDEQDCANMWMKLATHTWAAAAPPRPILPWPWAGIPWLWAAGVVWYVWLRRNQISYWITVVRVENAISDDIVMAFRNALCSECLYDFSAFCWCIDGDWLYAKIIRIFMKLFL